MHDSPAPGSSATASPEPVGREGALPNLVVVGAMKCGTSSLHYYLDLHPEIAMSSPKELDFFFTEPDVPVSAQTPPESRPRRAGNWDRGIEWYAAHFDPAAPVRGESSPNYSDPWYPGVPARMASIVPGAKIVLLTRHPIDRMVSNHRHMVVAGREAEPLDQAVRRPGNIFVRRSLYATMAETFLGSFPREHVMLLRDEDLLQRRRETMARVFGFLGVDDGFWSDKMERLRHQSAGKGRLRNAAERLGLHRLAGRLGLGAEAKWWIERAVSRPTKVAAPALSPETRREVLADLEPEIAGLERLTGWDLAAWRV
ncbi:MAG: sulfotransferase family protein [Alphaproteobacteria bacterium]